MCGSHPCSKFDSPIQYFILYPATSLGTSATLTFPDIATPPYSGDFRFQTRVYKTRGTAKKGYFDVTITPDTLLNTVYNFHANETITQLYPNADHFYTV